MDNLLWLARHPRFLADPLNLARRVMRSARVSRNLDEAGFATLLQAALPHRTITAAMVRVWEEKPPPPPGDVLVVAVGLLGLDLAAELAEEPTEAISGRTARVTIRHVGRDAADLLDVLQDVAIDPDRLRAAARGETRVDRRLIDDLAALTREYWCLYHTLAPRTLLPATGAHFDLVCRLLEAAPFHLRRDLGLGGRQGGHARRLAGVPGR